MAIEKPDGAESIASIEATRVEEGVSVAAIQASNTRAWYAYFNEDVLATLFGLFLVILLVVGLLHAIP